MSEWGLVKWCHKTQKFVVCSYKPSGLNPDWHFVILSQASVEIAAVRNHFTGSKFSKGYFLGAIFLPSPSLSVFLFAFPFFALSSLPLLSTFRCLLFYLLSLLPRIAHFIPILSWTGFMMCFSVQSLFIFLYSAHSGYRQKKEYHLDASVGKCQWFCSSEPVFLKNTVTNCLHIFKFKLNLCHVCNNYKEAAIGNENLSSQAPSSDAHAMRIKRRKSHK